MHYRIVIIPRRQPILSLYKNYVPPMFFFSVIGAIQMRYDDDEESR